MELVFKSTLTNTYRVIGGSYNERTNREGLDEALVYPAKGAIDPLKAFHSEHARPAIDRYYERKDPGVSPFVVKLDLNELLRFDRTGEYRVYVTTSRVQRALKAGDSDEDKRWGYAIAEAASNIIELRIVAAGPEWQRNELQTALQTIDADEVRRDQTACRVVRFLDTPDAIREMARRYGRDSLCNRDFGFGLEGSRDRAAVVHELVALLEAPDAPISSTFLMLLDRLAPLPHPANTPGAFAPYVQRLAALCPRKTGPAHTECVYTLLNASQYSSGGRPPWFESVRKELPSTFEQLDLYRQGMLLSDWQLVNTPEMLPVLRQVFEKNPPPPSSDTDLVRSVRFAALERIHEFMPAEARKLALEAIRAGTLPVERHALDFLPDQPMPELDDALAANLERAPARSNDFTTAAALIARYGTRRIAARVAALCDRQSICRDIPAIYAYFLRVDSSAGAARLKARMDGESDVTRIGLVGSIAEFYWSPQLEEIALDCLASKEINVRLLAMDALVEHGSPAAKAALFGILERVHAEWQGRASELRLANLSGGFSVSAEASVAATMERAAIEGLKNGSSWLLTSEDMARLRSLCVSEDACRMVSGPRPPADNPSVYLVSGPDYGSAIRWQAGDYTGKGIAELKQKLSLFPAGTTFRWLSSGSNLPSSLLEEVFTELSAFVEQHGMKIEKQRI